jgi:hypothetical protein
MTTLLTRLGSRVSTVVAVVLIVMVVIVSMTMTMGSVLGTLMNVRSMAVSVGANMMRTVRVEGKGMAATGTAATTEEGESAATATAAISTSTKVKWTLGNVMCGLGHLFIARLDVDGCGLGVLDITVLITSIPDPAVLGTSRRRRSLGARIGISGLAGEQCPGPAVSNFGHLRLLLS